LLAARIGEQAVEHSGKMLKVEANGGYSAWPCPQEFLVEACHERFDFFTSLQERVHNGLKQGGDIGQWASQPDFRSGVLVHRADPI
jgi:hypothetical protein